MPLLTNNTKLDFTSDFSNDNRETMIGIENVSMVFNMASEQLNNLKEYFISIVRHNLFFKELKALEDISFEIKRGDVFGIVGTNGSGKSTLLKIVAGVLEPTSGHVQINGAIAPLIELGAGFDMDLSARENIYLNGALLGYNKSFIDQHFDKIVEFAEVEKFLDMPMKNYSSGMVARIAFAIATVMVPEILIVDEVLSVGDFMFQKKCEDRILDLIEHHNTTVLIVSHSNDQVARLCNKAIWIEKGKTRMLGDANKVCEIYGLVGGRLGSLDSEQTIIKASEEAGNIDTSDISFYTLGGSYADIALSLAKHASQDNIETVCIAPHLTHVGIAIANAVAGAYNAPLVCSEPNSVERSVQEWLEFIKPKQIVIVNHGNAPAQRELKKIAEDIGSEIVDLSGELNCGRFSMSTYDKLYNSGYELGKPFIGYVDDTLTLDVIVSPHSYRDTRPIILLEDDNIKHFDEVLSWFKNNNIDEVTVLNNPALETILPLLENAKIAWEFAFSENSDENYIQQAKDLTKAKTIDEVVVIADIKNDYASAASAGYYCKENNGATLIVDDTSLDSIADAIRFIKDHKVKRIAFLKGAGSLSHTTETLLARIAKNNNLSS